MRVKRVIWLPAIVDKLASKHSVTPEEVEDVLYHPRLYVRRIERGYRSGEDIYAAMGQSAGGRYLVVFFIYKHSQEALIVSARDMEGHERRTYERR